MMELTKGLISLTPVLIFLAALIFLDSYKLVSPRMIVLTIVAGGISALVSAVINNAISSTHAVSTVAFSRYVAPLIEESAKAAFVVVLFRLNRIGFMVDAAIYGFAVGAGFSLVENAFYLYRLDTGNILVWVIRGFGTAAMHASTMAMLAVMAKNLIDREGHFRWWAFVPGLLLAYVIHSLFNHFILSPTLSTVLLLVVLPLLVILIFQRSEKSTQDWLGVGFDADQELIRQLSTGEFEQTKIGLYLQSLRDRFPSAVVVDMFCLLRIHTELALRAKGIMMMRQAGIEMPPDPELKEQLNELKFLERSIGPTGKLAIQPFVHTSSRDLWQLTTIK
jgi:RsiW-degrading membrane proteinase PrsW (M82 family)